MNNIVYNLCVCDQSLIKILYSMYVLKMHCYVIIKGMEAYLIKNMIMS